MIKLTDANNQTPLYVDPMYISMVFRTETTMPYTVVRVMGLKYSLEVAESPESVLEMIDKARR